MRDRWAPAPALTVTIGPRSRRPTASARLAVLDAELRRRADEVGAALRRRGETVGVAEGSCGGLCRQPCSPCRVPRSTTPAARSSTHWRRAGRSSVAPSRRHRPPRRHRGVRHVPLPVPRRSASSLPGASAKAGPPVRRATVTAIRRATWVAVAERSEHAPRADRLRRPVLEHDRLRRRCTRPAGRAARRRRVSADIPRRGDLGEDRLGIETIPARNQSRRRCARVASATPAASAIPQVERPDAPDASAMRTVRARRAGSAGGGRPRRATVWSRPVELGEVRMVLLDARLADVQRAVAIDRHVVRRSDGQVGVGGAEHGAEGDLAGVCRSTWARTASSSRNLPYLARRSAGTARCRRCGCSCRRGTPGRCPVAPRRSGRRG